MSLSGLLKRNLRHHWRMHLAVMLGVAAATSAIAGAMIVGDSMRGSLRDAALGRLGPITHALQSPRFVREAMADDLRQVMGDQAAFAPLIMLRGQAVQADTRARANNVSVRGVNSKFFKLWKLATQTDDLSDVPLMQAGGFVINDALADAVGARVGDDLILQIENPQDISPETILGRSEKVVRTVRRPVSAILSASGAMSFDLKPSPRTPLIAYLPLSEFQAALDREGLVNAIVVSGVAEKDGFAKALRASTAFDDVGIRVRSSELYDYVAVESDRFLIDPEIEHAIRTVADSMGVEAGAVLTYLANEIAVPNRDSSIPYSTISGVDAACVRSAGFTLRDGSPAPALHSGDILLNEWSADALQAEIGDRIMVSYYVTGDMQKLETRASTFTLRGVVRLSGAASDPHFTPTYEGVTDVENLADWDPPFPMDLKRVKQRDEDYWDKYGATPKAFVSLEDAQRLWADDGDRFGRVTSLRISPPDNLPLQAFTRDFEQRLRNHLPLAKLGLAFTDVRTRALKAAEGSTDFAGLFIGFSFFLIVSAAILVALLFRLGVEQRASEVGLLLSLGFHPKRVSLLLILEGLVVAGIGSGIGLTGAAGYAWVMLAGLGSWWSDAVNLSLLQLHITPQALLFGFVSGLLESAITIAWSIRGFSRLPVNRLLDNVTTLALDVQQTSHRRRRSVVIIAGVSTVLFSVAPVFLKSFPQPVAFFLAGASALVTMLAISSQWLSRQTDWPTHSGLKTRITLARRNAPRHPLRSLLTMTLIAFATFLVIALQAFRIDPEITDARTGGFTLFAEATTPIPYDISDPDSAESAGLSDISIEHLQRTRISEYRLRPGESASCVNLYLPQKPRILGATDRTIEQGGFRFSATMVDSGATSQAEFDTHFDKLSANPWHLLHTTFDDGAIPVIGDEAAVKWQLHSGLGKDFVIQDERNRDVRLRFVALLKESVLQDEIVVADSHFKTLFPSISGYGFFLLKPDAMGEQRVQDENLASQLERDLTRFGLDVQPCSTRLRAYFAVQNTYLSTFQTLGGLGLLLGTIGLAAILLRNVWERRSELGLMQAIGFTRSALGQIVFYENAILIVAGLVSGIIPALIAVIPRLIDHPESVPIASMTLLLSVVAMVALLSCGIALSIALRTPLLRCLNSE